MSCRNAVRAGVEYERLPFMGLKALDLTDED